MKALFIGFLVLAVALLAFDEKIQRTKVTDAQAALDASQAESGRRQEQINTLQTQVDQLKTQVASLQQLKSVIVAATPVPTPAPAAPVPQAPAQTGTATSMQLVADYSSALVIIEGKKGIGSGFLCNMEGRTYVITNAHVVADNPGFKITSITGKVFTPGASAVAVGHDLVRIEVADAGKAFDGIPNLDASVKIGDVVTILGNPEGAGVVKPVEGKIVGIGPDLIEVDAPFVKGNSGSPIIHQLSGKVLGVATYLMERKVEQGAQGGVQVETRRFGYRLDGIKQWEQINWQSFFAQSAQLNDMEILSEDFVKMFGDSAHGLDYDPTSYASPALQRSVRTFVEAARQAGKMSVSDKKILVERFIADLRSVTHSDILAFNKNTAYDYFRREVEDQSRFRDELYEGLTRAMQNN